jgi:hypothetical protein
LASTFGGVLIATLALPPLILASEHWRQCVIVAVAGILATIAVWLLLTISWSQWCACAGVLTGYVAALAGTAVFLRRVGVSAVVAAAIVVVVSLAWLGWPIWLSPSLVGHPVLVNWLVFAHPLLALNGTLIDQGIWTERTQMYGWTALNQDVSYSMPMSVFWCVTLHGGAGLVLAVVGSIQVPKVRGLAR